MNAKINFGKYIFCEVRNLDYLNRPLRVFRFFPEMKIVNLTGSIVIHGCYDLYFHWNRITSDTVKSWGYFNFVRYFPYWKGEMPTELHYSPLTPVNEEVCPISEENHYPGHENYGSSDPPHTFQEPAAGKWPFPLTSNARQEQSLWVHLSINLVLPSILSHIQPPFLIIQKLRKTPKGIYIVHNVQDRIQWWDTWVS